MFAWYLNILMINLVESIRLTYKFYSFLEIVEKALTTEAKRRNRIKNFIL